MQQETQQILKQKEQLVQVSKQRTERFATWMSSLNKATSSEQVSQLKRSFAEMIERDEASQEPASKKPKYEFTYHPL